MIIKNKSNIYNITLIIIAFLVTILFYNKLPELMPIHWNSAGEIDNYASKLVASLLAPVIMLLTYVGMIFLPKIDPKKDNYKKFSGSYSIIISLFITFFFVLHIVTMAISLGYDVPINKVIPFMVGILFIVIGNYLPKAKSNFFYGIKTPWTLTNEESWRKTHRLGGRLFVLSGIVTIISAVLFSGNVQMIILLISISIAAIVPIVASYFYAKVNRK